MVTAGTSYLSASDRRILVGLGAADRVDRLTIRWPSGKTQTWSDLAAGQSLVIAEGGEPLPAAEAAASPMTDGIRSVPETESLVLFARLRAAPSRGRTRYESEPSVISIDRSAGRSRKVWLVPLPGHDTVRASMDRASPSPMVGARLLPPKLEPPPMTRWIERRPPSGVLTSRRTFAPTADRLAFVPTSFIPSQWRPCPGFRNRTLCARSPGVWPPTSTNRSRSPSTS